MPTINVIIPVWNRAHAITRAIASVIRQELPARDWSVHVLVVDDGSTDNLAGALSPYGSRVTCIRHDKNAGTAAARNTGVAAAKCDYLAFLDSDDTWYPQKLITQIAFMQTNGYAISCTACKQRRRPSASAIVWPRYETRLLALADIVWGCFLSPGTTMICEPRVFEETGPFDTTLRRHEDWDWLLRFVSRCDLPYLSTPLAHREPSAFSKHSQTLEAIKRIRLKYLTTLPLPLRRSFEAALAFETAAAHYHQRNLIAASAALLTSMWQVPTAHAALGAIVAGRFAKR